MKYAYMLLAAFTLALLVMPVYADTTTQTWFFRSDYTLQTRNTATDAYSYIQRVGSYSGYLGFRIYVDEREVTNGVSAVILCSVTYTGFKTSTFNMPSTRLNYNVSTVKVEVYMRLGTDAAWQKKAEFNTQTLPYTCISGTWVFNVYVDYYKGAVSELTFYFGSSTYNSRIGDIELTEPTVYEIMMYRLSTGDLIGFIVYPYVNLLGNLFYGVLVLLICMPLYLRYRNITVILFLMTLLGGVGGVFSLLIPESGLQLAWLIFVLGLAGLLYKVFFK